MYEPNTDNPKYAIYYREAEGCICVKPLGAGAQGAAILCRSTTTGEYVVWKKAAIDCNYHNDPRDPRDCPEVSNWIDSPHVPRLVDFKLFPESCRDAFGLQPSMVIVSQFCNGGDLYDFSQRFEGETADENFPENFPEVLVWRLLSQLLGVVDILHRSLITHHDILPQNIFLNWKGEQRLPDFYLGDFGRAIRNDLTLNADGTVAEDRSRQAVARMAHDFRSLAMLIPSLITAGACNGSPRDDGDLDSDELWNTASEDLRQCYYRIMALGQRIPAFMEDAIDCLSNSSLKIDVHAKEAELTALCSSLEADIDAKVAELEALHSRTATTEWEAEGDHSALEKPRPPLFNTREELLHLARLQVPGPWFIAAVDPVTLEVLDVDPTEHGRLNTGMIRESESW